MESREVYPQNNSANPMQRNEQVLINRAPTHIIQYVLLSVGSGNSHCRMKAKLNPLFLHFGAAGKLENRCHPFFDKALYVLT